MFVFWGSILLFSIFHICFVVVLFELLFLFTYTWLPVDTMSFFQRLSEWASSGGASVASSAAGGAAVGNILRLGDVTVVVEETLAQGEESEAGRRGPVFRSLLLRSSLCL